MLNRIKKLLNIKTKEEELSAFDKINNLFDSLNEDTILIQIGSDLAPFGEYICSIIGELREEIKDECGFILPAVRTIDNNYYQENEYTISILGKLTENGFLIPTQKGIKEELYEALKTTIYNNLDSIFTNDIVERYIKSVQCKNNWLVWNISCALSVIELKAIMLGIIKNGKSINNINYIFEQIGEQVLHDGEYKDYLKKYNTQTIASQIAKNL